MNGSTATRAVPHRAALRFLGLLTAFLLLVISGPGAATASGAAKDAALVGQWSVRVTVYVQDPPLRENAVFTFLADNKLDTVTNPAGPDPIPGEGIWRVDGRGTFTFWITHPHPDENGNTIGTTNAVHLGKVGPGWFSTTATAYIAPLDGSAWFGPVLVTTEGVRLKG